jgi:hypothetical protein
MRLVVASIAAIAAGATVGTLAAATRPGADHLAGLPFDADGHDVPTVRVVSLDRVTFTDPLTEVMGRAALAGLAWPWAERLPGWRIEFKPGIGRMGGYTWPAERRIEIFVRDGVEISHLRRVLAHELGHAVDVSHLGDDDRLAWRDLRNLAAIPWFPEPGERDFATGAGDFAESFAVWLVGGELFRSELGPPPGPAERALLEALIGSPDQR